MAQSTHSEINSVNMSDIRDAQRGLGRAVVGVGVEHKLTHTRGLENRQATAVKIENSTCR
jgi:hypothetical protein